MDFDDALAALAEVGRDLTALAARQALPPVWCRDDDADALLRDLEEGRSVLLVGPEGVGRTSVLHAAARRLAAREDRFPLIELSTTALLAGTKFLGEWQTKVSTTLAAAETTGAVLVFTDLHALPTAGTASNSDANMLDAIRPWVQAGRVRIVGEASPPVLRRLERVPDLIGLFTELAVEPLPAADVDAVLEASATAHGLDLDPDGRLALVDLTQRFLPARPQPGPALELLRRVKDYQEQKAGIDEHERADAAFIEKVFAIYSGLPKFVVSRSATRSASEIRAWFEDRLVGQGEAIDAVVQSIALFKAGLHDPKRPLGTFLFVGPTGVGKTELARALAAYLFGSAHRLLRFDLGEYADPASFQRLLGNPHDAREPALLADPLRAQPFQVVLFDELEKAHPHVFDVLLALLDEGRVSTPRGEVIDLRNTFVICTSNVGAQQAGKGVGFGVSGDTLAERDRLLTALQTAFRPELLARFQHIVPFHPLTPEMVRRIARHALAGILERDGITSRNLVVEVDDAALDRVIEHGYDPRWGARGLLRELQRRVVLPIAMTLMEKRVDPGQILKVVDVDGHLRVRRLDTETSREARREAEPIPFAGGKATRDDLAQALRTLHEDLEALSLGVGEEGVREAQAELLEARQDPEFWFDEEGAARLLRDLDHLTLVLDRLDRLRTRVADFETDLARSDTRARLVALARRLEGLQEAMSAAFRELVWVGRDGFWDALVEVRPLSRSKLARDVLVGVYRDWAAWREAELVWLHEPRGEMEAAWFAVKGRFAQGFLGLESGVHRVRDGDDHDACRVRVIPWTDRTAPVDFADHRALKGIGAYGGRIRSRLACSGGVVFQNANTLAENRHLAMEVVGAWRSGERPSDVVVRRYDLGAPLVRDVLTGVTSGRPDALTPERFHELLCQRIEAIGVGPDAA